MNDKDWVLDDDGSRYAIFLQVPDDPNKQYGVDLVRQAQDEQGLLREQRLTLAQYNSYGEAEEHFYEAEQQLQDRGLEGFDVDALATMPYSDTPTILSALYPPDAAGHDFASANILALSATGVQSVQLARGEVSAMETVLQDWDAGGEQHLTSVQAEPVRHVDERGTTHWFEIAERQRDEDASHELRYCRSQIGATEPPSAYPVMPLADEQPQSAWMLPDLEKLLAAGDVFAAQQLAYEVADFYGEDFPAPLDLVDLDAPPQYNVGYGMSDKDLPALEVVKTWVEGATRHFDTLTVGEYASFDDMAADEAALLAVLEEEGLDAGMNLAESMATANGLLDPERDDPRLFFAEDAPADPFITQRELDILFDEQDVSPNPDYYFLSTPKAEGWQLGLMKTWTAHDERFFASQPLADYAELEELHVRKAQLDDLLVDKRVSDALHMAEALAVSSGYLDPERDDPRLFTQGLPDPFTTLAQAQQHTMIPDLDADIPDESQERQPYWRLDTIPVNDPHGAALGHALHMVVYDGVEHNPDGIGTPLMAEDEPFRMLEMAHFETMAAADEFGKEFHLHVKPGLLDAPELAVEVARLEELPVGWKSLEGDDLRAYLDGAYALTRDLSDWHPYNPNAERDARIAAEGMYTDPIHQCTTFDEDEEDPKVEPAAPDLDL